MPEDKKIIVSAKALADIHNILFTLNVSGEATISVANCMMSLRQMIDKSPEYKEEEAHDEPND